jgi:hypothetical protein
MVNAVADSSFANRFQQERSSTLGWHARSSDRKVRAAAFILTLLLLQKITDIFISQRTIDQLLLLFRETLVGLANMAR